MQAYGVVLAGGDGKRFWPLSRKAVPKQFLNLTGNDVLINETINRINKVIASDNIFIVANKNQEGILDKVVTSKIRKKNILLEPVAKNTAACICYAAFKIMKEFGDGIMCVFPSDHYINDEQEFINVVKYAVDTATNIDKLVTIGIRPSFASIGYGYIEINDEENRYDFGKAYNVEKFIEKPSYDKAKVYIDSGNYLWNSGMFVWKISVLLNSFKEYLPDVYNYFYKFSKHIGTDIENEKISETYVSVPSISIDYGIMEQSNNVIVIPGCFGWNDIGSWDSLNSLYPCNDSGNINIGENIILDSINTTVYSNNKLVVALGLEDLIIVETDDTTLVCNKNKTQDIKKIVAELENLNRLQYL